MGQVSEQDVCAQRREDETHKATAGTELDNALALHQAATHSVRRALPATILPCLTRAARAEAQRVS